MSCHGHNHCHHYDSSSSDSDSDTGHHVHKHSHSHGHGGHFLHHFGRHHVFRGPPGPCGPPFQGHPLLPPFVHGFDPLCPNHGYLVGGHGGRPVVSEGGGPGEERGGETPMGESPHGRSGGRRRGQSQRQNHVSGRGRSNGGRQGGGRARGNDNSATSAVGGNGAGMREGAMGGGGFNPVNFMTPAGQVDWDHIHDMWHYAMGHHGQGNIEVGGRGFRRDRGSGGRGRGNGGDNESGRGNGNREGYGNEDSWEYHSSWSPWWAW